MAVIQAVIALLSRQAGRLLNMVFGWATTLLFGKVPQDRQMTLSLISFGSVAWIILCLGVAVPSVGTFLLAFVPLPSWVDDRWVRLGMLAGALFLPLVIGGLSLRLYDESRRPKGVGGYVKAVLRGYPTTLGLALTLLMLIVFAPIMQVRAAMRHWSTAHVPILVEPADYRTVVGELERALATQDIATRRQRASWMLRFPTKVLTKLASGAVERSVTEELIVLHGEELEATLHPADLVLVGQAAAVGRARAAVAEQLAFSRAHLTWTKEANALEDRVRAVWQDMQHQRGDFLTTVAPRRLQAIVDELEGTTLPFEEWEVVNRQVGLVDRSVLSVAAGALRRPDELLETDERLGSVHLADRKRGAERSLLRVLGVAGIALVLWYHQPVPYGAASPGDLLTIARSIVRG
jgi:hypothetical protein